MNETELLLVGKMVCLKILVGEASQLVEKSIRKRYFCLLPKAQDSRFESENTIYDEMPSLMTCVGRDNRAQMELEMGVKSLREDLDKSGWRIMIVYQHRGYWWLTHEAIRAILNGQVWRVYVADENCWVVKNSVLHWLKCSLKSQNSGLDAYQPLGYWNHAWLENT